MLQLKLNLFSELISECVFMLICSDIIRQNSRKKLNQICQMIFTITLQLTGQLSPVSESIHESCVIEPKITI